ncbi:T9SS type B sorting domain-containing protein [Lacibacter sp. H407]|uniref:T9SS type B sorting domain-containing protein n=1 Tax=Lacibacter sp. H407 TaxID=3133423 RepID=UPI0030C49164
MFQRLLICLLLLTVTELRAQVCTLPGQTPATAFLICGNGSYEHATLAPCRNNGFFVAGCTNSNTSYGDNNPVYYKFTCNTSGTFSFSIIPKNNVDNYDWFLFDITGRDPQDIFSDRSLSIIGNWSGSTGPTGASASGVSFTQCRSLPQDGLKPTFAVSPQLQAGRTYLLMVGNMDNTPAGFTLAVGGGSADISSPAAELTSISNSSCINNELVLRFSNNIRCNSIAADGSNFRITPAAAFSINTVSCTGNAETDSVILRFTNTLTSGSYSISLQTGTNGTTLTDICGNTIPNETRTFDVYPFSTITSAEPESCRPKKINIRLSKEVSCSSVSVNGSDFTITGPSSVTVIKATTICTTNYTNAIELELQQPLVTGGLYTISINNGSDGNTLINACNDVTPATTSFSFELKDTVNASYTYAIAAGCTEDSVSFSHPGGNGINNWYWDFGNNQISKEQSPVILFANSGYIPVRLVVNNGFCADTSTQELFLQEKMNIDFEFADTICAGEQLLIVDKSTNAKSWLWDLGNGNSSTLKNPPLQNYPQSNSSYPITLTISDSICALTVTKNLTVQSSCSIIMPNAFTPNSDGINDSFGPLQTGLANGMELLIYNRYGQLIFQSQPNNLKWFGTMNGKKQPPGLYSWRLKYTDQLSGKTFLQTGTVLLLR